MTATRTGAAGATEGEAEAGAEAAVVAAEGKATGIAETAGKGVRVPTADATIPIPTTSTETVMMMTMMTRGKSEMVLASTTMMTMMIRTVTVAAYHTITAGGVVIAVSIVLIVDTITWIMKRMRNTKNGTRGGARRIRIRIPTAAGVAVGVIGLVSGEETIVMMTEEVEEKEEERRKPMIIWKTNTDEAITIDYRFAVVL